MYKHILLPTDGSPLSARAVAAGVGLARAVGASVTGLFVAPPATPVLFRHKLPVGYIAPDRHAELIEREAARALGAVEKAAKAARVACRLERVVGDFPAEAILEAAKRRRCDLIVMASHGRSGLKAVLLGSETQKVLAHAKVPVLVHR
ncbi:TRAP-T-associated universal stress protein TeaD [Burkholderiales bacterium]|nr:TRAP-T-associated universal stress protein TeaD [Burkholderiales bacterium]